MLIDEVHISVKAGNGGNGGSTMKRNAQTSRGGPDGGNGGNGGDIYAIGVDDITALSQFQFKKKIVAEDGVRGKKNNLYGKNAPHTTLKLPLGSSIINEETGEEIEIVDTHIPILLAKGGKGGLGNNALKTAINQAPKHGIPGEAGESKKLTIILRLIADIGLIGLPNAGKSSLLSVLTNAHPKIGDYPFTTLEPNLGMMDNFVIADIPGLIAGASKGKGLGTKFLKHVEKTKILVHCIDISTEDIKMTYDTVRNELLMHNAYLSEKQEIILLTKTDLVQKDELEKKIEIAKSLNEDVYTVSIYNEKEIEDFKKILRDTISR